MGIQSRGLLFVLRDVLRIWHRPCLGNSLVSESRIHLFIPLKGPLKVSGNPPYEVAGKVPELWHSLPVYLYR